MTSTRTTVRASSFSASRCAVVAPTLPAPTTVILLSMGSGEWSDGTKLTGSVRLFTHARSAIPVAVDDNDGSHDVAGGVTGRLPLRAHDPQPPRPGPRRLRRRLSH